MSATEETVLATTVPPPAIVAPPAPAGEAAKPGETGAAPDATQERDDKGRFKNPLQPRIDELTKARRQAEREAQFWRSQAEAAAPPAQAKPEKPTPEKYENYNEYVEALTDWKADERVHTALDERDKAASEKKQAEARASTWEGRREVVSKEIADYDAVMEASEVPIKQHVANALYESEEGPRIAYHLDRNPDVAAKLNAMTETQAAREIGRLEVLLKPVSAPTPEPKPAETPAPAKRATNAPPPVKPIGQSKSNVTDLTKVGMDEYIETRRKQGASWARR